MADALQVSGKQSLKWIGIKELAEINQQQGERDSNVSATE